uniref:Chemokine interleukin-8-like domain-containing protein n=1 Tax=Ursus maritimus TaxID=29073 RepID=A0A452TLN5_URSMA
IWRFTLRPHATGPRVLQSRCALSGDHGLFCPGTDRRDEFRERCLQTLQGIHLKNIQNVKVTPSGPHCAQTEVIATLKNGQEVCLNPEAPMVKKIINKMLNK